MTAPPLLHRAVYAVSATMLGLAPAFGVAAQHGPSAPGSADARSWSYALGGATDHRSKGLSKNDGQPYGWASAKRSIDNDAFYAGVLASVGAVTSELELSAGAQREGAVDVELEISYKWSLDSDRSEIEGEWQASATLSRDLGSVAARLLFQFNPGEDASGWIEGRLTWAMTDTLSPSVALGRRARRNGPDYDAWNLGVTWTIAPNLSGDLRFYDTDADDLGEVYDEAVVAAITAKF